MVWGVPGVDDGEIKGGGACVGCCLTRGFGWGRGGICFEDIGLLMVVGVVALLAVGFVSMEDEGLFLDDLDCAGSPSRSPSPRLRILLGAVESVVDMVVMELDRSDLRSSDPGSRSSW